MKHDPIAVSDRNQRGQAVSTRTGKIEIERGYPSTATVEALYDEMDFQRAVQTYLWAMPAVAQNELRLGLERDLGVGTNDVVIFDNFVDPSGVFLTANNTTIYIGAYLNLERDGAMVLDMPLGLLGMIDNLWQVPLISPMSAIHRSNTPPSRHYRMETQS